MALNGKTLKALRIDSENKTKIYNDLIDIKFGTRNENEVNIAVSKMIESRKQYDHYLKFCIRNGIREV